MKTKLLIFTALLLSGLSSVSVQAQNCVIGYVQVEKIFAEWPETKRANTELQDYEARLLSRLEAKVQDFQAKLESYEQNRQNMDSVTRQDTEAELQNLQTQAEQYNANAQRSVADKNAELLQPLQTKLENTINQVAKEGGYTHIFTSGSILVFTTDTSGDISDISSAVARKLGFTLSE